MTEQAQLQDLGRQARNGFTIVERLTVILDEILEDELCFFETADTRNTAIFELASARYFLKTGHLPDYQDKGDDSEQD